MDVQKMASSILATQLDPSPKGVSAGIASDAAQALVQVQSGQPLPPTTKHAILQQAHAHFQQICPELHPEGLAAAAYESELLRMSSCAFAATSIHRNEVPPAPFLELATEQESMEEGTISIRLSAQGGAAIAIVAFHVEVFVATLPNAESESIPNTTMDSRDAPRLPVGPWSAMNALQPISSEDWSITPEEALTGVKVTLSGLPIDTPLQITATASNGSLLGSPSLALICYAHVPQVVPLAACDEKPVSTLQPDSTLIDLPSPFAENSVGSSLELTRKISKPSAKRQSLSKSRRSSSNLLAGSRRNTLRLSTVRTVPAPDIRIVQAVANPPNAVTLSWTVNGQQLQGQLWSVRLTGMSNHQVLGGEVRETQARIEGLERSEAYRLRLEVVDPPKLAAAQLWIQGNAIGRSRAPRAAEGVILLPPFPDALLESLRVDPSLEQLSDGIFITKVPHSER